MELYERYVWHWAFVYMPYVAVLYTVLLLYFSAVRYFLCLSFGVPDMAGGRRNKKTRASRSKSKKKKQKNTRWVYPPPS